MLRGSVKGTPLPAHLATPHLLLCALPLLPAGLSLLLWASLGSLLHIGTALLAALALTWTNGGLPGEASGYNKCVTTP